MSKENLLKKIKQDALNTAKSIVDEASSRTEAQLSKLKAELEECEKAQKEYLLRSAEEDLKRKLTVADIDKRKIILFKKQQIIDKVYQEAMQEIASLNNKEYIEFMASLIRLFAEDGDELIISESDKNRITKAFIDKIAKENAISLTLSSQMGDFLGGFILKNARYDKDLTLNAIVKSIRKETESDIVNILFVEQK